MPSASRARGGCPGRMGTRAPTTPGRTWPGRRRGGSCARTSPWGSSPAATRRPWAASACMASTGSWRSSTSPRERRHPGRRGALVRQHASDFWVLHGGGAEPGELTREAAAREVREETGLLVVCARAEHEWGYFARRALPANVDLPPDFWAAADRGFRPHDPSARAVHHRAPDTPLEEPGPGASNLSRKSTTPRLKPGACSYRIVLR